MIAARLALVLSVAPHLFPCPSARAQDALGARAGQGPDAVASDEIVVIGKRYGEARVAAETEYGEEEIASQGADSIGTLLDRLTSAIDPLGERPVLLINGRPAEGDRSILSYPAEALNRLEVLKPGASAHYGYSPERRVVNLVLKEHFASLTADAAASAATRGGQYGGDLSAGRVAIDGQARWNVQARLGRESALRKRSREIAPREGPFDSVGFVTGPGGAEIDPALSLALGRPVTLAGFPTQALSQPPVLADFAATAGAIHPVEPNAFETLLPSRRSLTFGAGMTRPAGDFSVTLGINANSTTTQGVRGLPMTSVVLPAASPWSPFARDVVLTRPFAGIRPLRSEVGSKALGMTFAASGRIGGWETALSAAYSRSWSDSLLERGIDAAAVQAAIDSGNPAFNPYGPLRAPYLLVSRDRTRGETLDARITAGKAVLDLPAGPLTTNVSVAVGRSTTESDRLVGAIAARRLASAGLGVSVPLSRRTNGALGDLSIELSAGGQTQSGGGVQTRFDAGVTWSPVPVLQLRGALEYAETVPSFEQLDAALVPGVHRVFDYARQETVDATWVTGGNPGLGRGRRENRSLTAQVRPFGDQRLTLNLGYREQVATGNVAPFPELTPAIEAAFPERVTRDGAGRLVAVDARPINLARDRDTDLRFGVALRLPGPRRPGAAAARPAMQRDRLQFSASINHRWRLRSEILTRAGMAVIDQLGDDGGQSRHSLSLQVAAGKRGIGTSLNGTWSSGTRLRNRAIADGSGDLRSRPPFAFNLSFFAEPEHLGRGGAGWRKNVRLSIDVRNLLAGYRHIVRPDGSIPDGYRRDQVDPLGRTIRMTVRKRF